MHEQLVSTLAGAAVLAGVFVVHELGHYIAGWVAGIPADDRRFVVLAVPPHVAIADDDGWASPFENERFGAAYRRHDPENRYGALFTAGGVLAQALLAAVAGGLAVLGDEAAVGTTVVRLSLAFLAGLVVVDAAATAWRGRPFSDASHLWRLDPGVAVAVFVGVAGVHVAVLWWLGWA